MTRRSTPVGLLDIPWLAMETRRHPMHVAGLIICRMPADAGPTFVRDLAHDLTRFRTASAPFDRRLRVRGHVWPRWVPVSELEVGEHVRHHVLAPPGDDGDLEALVSDLHRLPLDLSRPLWEYHLIDGLADGRFAVYAKFHHSMVDGVGAVRILQSAFTTDPARRDMPPVWAYVRDRPPRSTDKRRTATVLARLARTRLRRARTAARPRAPRSILNTGISPERAVSFLRIEMGRLRRLASAMGGTLNDALLMVCSSGLRSYLVEQDALPPAPLVAAVPMSVRAGGGVHAGNAITFLFPSLATDEADPRARAHGVIASSARAKARVANLDKQVIDLDTVATMAPFIATQLVGLGARVRPMFNIAISNIAGSADTLFHNGMEVLAIRPVSVLQSGQALNITALSYTAHMDVTFTANQDALPDIRSLAQHCRTALDQLEREFASEPS